MGAIYKINSSITGEDEGYQGYYNIHWDDGETSRDMNPSNVVLLEA